MGSVDEWIGHGDSFIESGTDQKVQIWELIIYWLKVNIEIIMGIKLQITGVSNPIFIINLQPDPRILLKHQKWGK